MIVINQITTNYFLLFTLYITLLVQIHLIQLTENQTVVPGKQMRILILVLKPTIEIVFKNHSFKISSKLILKVLIQSCQVSSTNYFPLFQLMNSDSIYTVLIHELYLSVSFHELRLLCVEDQKVKVVSEVLSNGIA